MIAVEPDWRKKMPGYTGERLCREIGEALFTSKAGEGTPKYLVMNDDIDIPV